MIANKISKLFLPCLWTLLLGTSLALAQSNTQISPVSTISPPIFPINQRSQMFLSVTNGNPNSKQQITPGDVFQFSFDSTAGTELALESGVFVNSSVLTPADFVLGLDATAREIMLTYVGLIKVFPPGDSFGLKVSAHAPNRLTAGIVTFEAPPVKPGGRYSGALPTFTTISFVDFPVGTAGPEGPEGPQGRQGPPGPTAGPSSIVTTMLADSAVSSAKIAPAAVAGAHIAPKAVASEHLATKAVKSEHLDSKAVKSENLDAKAVKSEHLDAKAVKSEHLDMKVVKTEHIDSKAITADHIADRAVEARHLAAGAAVASISVPFSLSGSAGSIISAANTGNGNGVYGFSATGRGLSGESTGDAGVSGLSQTGDGVFGQSQSNRGVAGFSNSGPGVFGSSSSNTGVYAQSGSADGVYGTSSEISRAGVFGDNNTGSGVIGFSVSGTGVFGQTFTGVAGRFLGNVEVSGTLIKSSGSFKIDHPLDPANKFLYHSFVESPDMKNVYDGVVTVDRNGEAVVELPDWFQALNRDFRYLLTAIGSQAPGLYISEEIANNRFKVAGGISGLKVSWQVTGIRRDAYANAHRISVEEQKTESERDHYLHPDLFGQPEEKGIEWAHNPKLMFHNKELGEQIQKNQSKHQ